MTSLFIRIAPIVFVCLWATGFVGARLGMPYAEPASFLAVRFVIAFVILALFAVAMGAQWPKGRAIVHTLIVGACVHGIYLGMVFWAVRNGMPGGVSAIIVGLQPVIAALLAGAWLKEKISRHHWLALAVGLIGVGLVLGPKIDIADSGINPTTIAACLISVAAISFGTIYQKRFATLTDLRTGTALQYIGALIPTLIFAFAYESWQIEWNAQSIFALVWLVGVLSILAVFLLMWLIREGSVAQVSSLFFLVPAVAALMTWVLFNETLVPLQIVGMALCAAAVALSATKGQMKLSGKTER